LTKLNEIQLVYQYIGKKRVNVFVFVFGIRSLNLVTRKKDNMGMKKDAIHRQRYGGRTGTYLPANAAHKEFATKQ
jgi:hypothetical protein